MATFYIQLKEKLLKISGDLTHDNIVKALGYTPSNFSGNFNDLSDNPFTQNEDGKFNITDEEGNIIATVDEEGIHSVDFIAGEHKLTDKIDATALDGLAKETWVTEYVTKTVTEGKVSLDGYATEEWVEKQGFAQQSDLENIDFNTLKENPFSDDENGELNITDDNGNVILKVNENGLQTVDVIAGDHILSNKVDKESGKGLSTEDFTTALKTKLQSLSNYDDTTITNAINTLREDFDTLVSGDTTTAIKTFNEIIAFLNGVEDTESLEGIIAGIEQQIANIEIPSLDGYATESWVENQNYLTKHQDISHLATKTEVNDSINDIEFFSIKNNPIADTEDGNLIFVDETGNIGLRIDKDNNLTVADVVAGEHVLSNKADKSDLEGLATESYVITKVAEAKLEGSDITIPVQDVKVNGQTVIKDMVAEIDLTPYAKSEDVPSIEGLATEQWVTDKNYLTEHQDISHLASTEYVNEQIANVDVTEQLKDYALKSELPVNVSDLNNDEGYLTQHQDISHLATKEELDSKDFYEIHNNPIVNDGDGKLVFVDESGNIGLQLEADNTLYVKDVVAGDDVLSNKMDITDNLVRIEDADGELDDVPEDVCVKYVTQSLTEEQKEQVRENIDAVSPNEFKTFNGESLIGTGDIVTKKELSILFVGNSLTQDGIAYLPYMLKNYYPEINFRIYMWYIGGKTLGDHYSNFTSSGKADIFSVSENSPSWTNYSKNTTMASVLSTYKFNIVCMQEYFNYKTSYENCADWNNCRDYIRTNYKGGNALEFISLFHAPLRKDGYDVHEVYERTEAGNALILQSTISDDIIPNGIAVYRALETDLNNLGDLGQLSPDGTHTQEGLPCLLQTWTTLCWLFDRLGMNRSIYGHPMRMTTAIYNTINVPGANLGSGVVQGTDAQNLLAQEVAIKAYKEGKQFLMRNLYSFEWGGGLKYGTITITCNVADAIIKINGLEQSSVTVFVGSTVTWEVTKDEYRPQSGTFVVAGDKDLNITLLPVVDIDSISAEFSQGQRTIFNEDDIEDLRKYLVVSVNYADGSSEITEDYTLSGTLSGGTSTMTASFGGKDTTFDVEVTDVIIPEGYTRYGWVSCSKTAKTSKAPSNFIYLAADEDWNRLSMECYIGKRPNVTHASGSGLFGARLASSTNSNPWYGLYVPVEKIRVDARNSNISVPYPNDMNKIKVVLDNRQTSPMYASANDGVVVEKAWTTSDVINVPMSLFNNIPDGSTTDMNFNYYFRIGEMKFRDYDGRCVYYYIPVTNSSKVIGMFDVINQRFCTAETVAAVTVGNSSCVHAVGNW